MRRKKKHEEHVSESWLIPYADILTLLLALFIVLFASSEVDSQKYQEIANSFNSALQGGSGVLDGGTNVNPNENNSPIPEIGEEAPVDNGEEQDDPDETEKNPEPTPEQDHQQLEELGKNIEAFIGEKGLSSKLQTEFTKEGLLITIADGVLFTPGSASISGEARNIAVEIANLLASEPPRQVRIEGHTDNVPHKNEEFPSNWELSSARAINFMKVLLENNTLDPRNFSAMGYSEYRPIASNDTEEGRAQNRRVEVLISTIQHQN